MEKRRWTRFVTLLVVAALAGGCHGRYRKAADQGHVEAQYNLGMSYHYGIGVDEDESLAAEWYGKASEQGHEPSQTGLSRLGDL